MKSMYLFLLGMFSVVYAFAQQSTVYTVKGVAIKGYDPVAYFLKQQPALGSDSFSHQWNGAQWNFESQANLNAFKLSPEKYAPQYGGYCAYGCSEAHLSPTDPMAWTIVDGKLYLNYNLKVKSLWLKDTSARIQAANIYWKKLESDTPKK